MPEAEMREQKARQELSRLYARISELERELRSQPDGTASKPRESGASNQLERAISIETVGVLFFSLNGSIRDANKAFERMSGYSKEELLDVCWRQLTPPEFMAPTEHAAEEIARTGTIAPYEKQLIRKNGSR